MAGPASRRPGPRGRSIIWAAAIVLAAAAATALLDASSALTSVFGGSGAGSVTLAKGLPPLGGTLSARTPVVLRFTGLTYTPGQPVTAEVEALPSRVAWRSDTYRHEQVTLRLRAIAGRARLQTVCRLTGAGPVWRCGFVLPHTFGIGPYTAVAELRARTEGLHRVWTSNSVNLMLLPMDQLPEVPAAAVLPPMLLAGWILFGRRLRTA
jgi:hypothetical protein